MKFWQSSNNPQYKLFQQDLLNISEEINQKYIPFDEHHQPILVLMPVDPINLYAYWNLKVNAANNNISHVDKQLALRIYSIPELSEHPDKLQLSFDIKVYGFRNQQKVHLPVAATAYSAVVGEINADNSFSALAVSDTIHVPRETPVADTSLKANKTLLQINKEQKNNIISTFDTKENATFARNIKESNNTLQINPKMDNHAYFKANALAALQSEIFILKNFNDYGYDLSIYMDGFAADFKNIMSEQAMTTHLSELKAKTIAKNISGQG